MRFGLTDETIAKIYSVFQRYGEVEEAIIYGSRAKGNYRPGSDIDITLRGSKLTDALRAQIWGELDDLNIPYIVDLSILHEIDSPDLQDHIRRIGQTLYRKPSINTSLPE